MEKLNKEQFEKLLNGEKPVVCDFFADWCGPCRMLAPVMEEMSLKYKDKAEFVKINVDEVPELSIRYGIMSIPLVTVFKNGEEAAKSLGYMSKTEADEFLSKNL
ncbi:MAG: thioredoxin [Clostridia bacterium]|nr:thioredoxin [Clostridia bacterium]